MTDSEPNSRAGMQFGPYRLQRLLGKGGMGEVYEAHDTVKDRTVALKLMSAQFNSDAVFRQRMQREAHTAGRLQEPHIVPIHDFGEIDGQLFIDMRFIGGDDLSALLKREGALTPPRAVAIITQVAAALDAAHRTDVIHRDIKPENILITGEDFAYLVDFGIAAAASDQQLTRTGTAVGSWRYMAPERFSDDPTTYRLDIYSLACVLFECLTGAAPYQTQNLSSLMAAHLMQPIPRPSSMRREVPRAFDDVIARGMAKDPAARYASAGELARAAKAALSAPDQDRATTMIAHTQHYVPPPSGAQPRSAPPGGGQPWIPPGPPAHHQPQWRPSAPPPTRKRWPIVAAVIGVLTLVAGTGIWFAVDGGDGSAQSSDTTTTRSTTSTSRPAVTTTATSAAPTVAAAQLDSLLLSPEQVNQIMGTTAIVFDHSVTETKDPGPDNKLSDEQCLGALVSFQTRTYKTSGYTGMAAQVLSDPTSRVGYVVVQGSVVFASAEQALTFVTTQQAQWRGCANRTITQINPGRTIEWSLHDVTGNPPSIALQREPLSGLKNIACERALHAVSNVVVDVDVCAPGITNQASQIADAMATKVPT